MIEEAITHGMTSRYNIFICHKWSGGLLAAKYLPCFNVVLLRVSISVSLVLSCGTLSISREHKSLFLCRGEKIGRRNETLKWIRCTDVEGSNVMRRYTLLTGKITLAHETGLGVSRTYVREVMNIVGVMKSDFCLIKHPKVISHHIKYA